MRWEGRRRIYDQFRVIPTSDRKPSNGFKHEVFTRREPPHQLREAEIDLSTTWERLPSRRQFRLLPRVFYPG